jgi:hypothetical protein
MSHSWVVMYESCVASHVSIPDDESRSSRVPKVLYHIEFLKSWPSF